MKADKSRSNDVLVVGDNKLAYSVAVNCLTACQEVLLLTSAPAEASAYVREERPKSNDDCLLLSSLPDVIEAKLVFLFLGESIARNQEIIRQVESRSTHDTIIAVHSDSIPLVELQECSTVLDRILGVNWAFPAHTSLFLEIIANEYTNPDYTHRLENLAKQIWHKDPYRVQAGFSIRGRMFAAMLREGLSLVENGFASIESIDRACRNDAGYYLPFAGNFRYMDLMGTYAYGMVMKDLNKELSNMNTLPDILKKKNEKGAFGMDSGQGFYSYSPEDRIYWNRIFKEFNEEIQNLILRYPHAPLNY
jgi:3-hydroxybutyryl-CoA dehydrogenase